MSLEEVYTIADIKEQEGFLGGYGCQVVGDEAWLTTQWFKPIPDHHESHKYDAKDHPKPFAIGENVEFIGGAEEGHPAIITMLKRDNTYKSGWAAKVIGSELWFASTRFRKCSNQETPVEQPIESGGEKCHREFQEKMGHGKLAKTLWDGMSAEQRSFYEGMFVGQQSHPKMTAAEHNAMQLLADAYGVFLTLPSVTQTQLEDYVFGIHRCQDQISIQVARRADPDQWR